MGNRYLLLTNQITVFVTTRLCIQLLSACSGEAKLLLHISTVEWCSSMIVFFGESNNCEGQYRYIMHVLLVIGNGQNLQFDIHNYQSHSCKQAIGK